MQAKSLKNYLKFKPKRKMLYLNWLHYTWAALDNPFRQLFVINLVKSRIKIYYKLKSFVEEIKKIHISTNLYFKLRLKYTYNKFSEFRT